MTTAEAVDGVLAEVDFTEPVELADVKTVHESIRARLLPDCRLESYHRRTEVVFEVRVGNDVVVRRVVKVVGAS